MFEEIATFRVTPSLSIWHRYDPNVKADLYSTVLATAAGVYLVDPIAAPPATLGGLLGEDGAAGIVVTNGNHARAAVDFSLRLMAPIYAHPEARTELAGANIKDLTDGEKFAPGLTAVTIDGAAPGEIALHCEADGGTLILGDALINMDALGFTFLPAKYCTNPKLMRRSLRKLLDFPFERMLFAHGTPITTRAGQRFAELLDGH